MRIVSISEIPKLMADETVPAVKGKLKYISDVYRGDGQHGKWSMQNIEIEAIKPDTGTVKAVIRDRATENDSSDWKIEKKQQGQVIYIYCNQGTKGMTGMKVKDEEDKRTKKEVRKLSITPTAHIEFPGNEAATPPQAQNQQSTSPAQTPDTEPQQAPDAGKKKPNYSPEEKLVVDQVRKKAKLMSICIRAAKWAIKEAGVENPPADKVISNGETLYIDSHRENLHTKL